MDKKKICLSGYVCGNLGDDLFFKVICERYKDTDFYIHGPKQFQHFYNKIKNLEYIPSDTRSVKRFLYHRLKNLGITLPFLLAPPKAHGHVRIGGSMFMEKARWEEIFSDNLNYLRYFKKNYILGANFGPYTSPEFVQKYNTYFSRLDDICFRDTYSANIFKHLAQVRQADDIVFQLNPPQGKNENYYVISPIYCKNRVLLKEHHDAYMKKLVEIIQALTQKGTQVVLMSFCDFEKDDVALAELYEKIEDTQKVTLHNHNDIEQSLHILANAKGIIATRFHAMILGFMFGKPTIPLIYSEKMRTVLQDMHYPGITYTVQDMESIHCHELIEHLENALHFNIEPMRKNAEKHFQELDKFLEYKTI